MNKRWNNAITDVPGIKVGHATNEEALTGCTVVLCEDGAVGGVDQRGGAPGMRTVKTAEGVAGLPAWKDLKDQ